MASADHEVPTNLDNQTPDLDTHSVNLPDVNRRPPTVPTALGTKLFPIYSLNFAGNLPIEIQMRDTALTRKRNESKHFFSNKHPDYLRFRDYYGSVFNYCSICSEYVNRKRRDMALVIHSHTSSMNYRINSDHRQSPWGEYFCNTCEIGFHGYKSGARYPVLVTSSILKDWQGIRMNTRYSGDKIHVDQVGVAGAKIDDLEFAFLAEYSDLYRPCDVLLVSGFNDLIRGRTPEQVMSSIRSFKTEVLKIHGSSFAVSTLPLPPSMSKLERDDYRLRRPDLTQEIIRLNDMIMEFNREPGQSMETARAPCFHTWGLTSRRLPKTIGPRNLLEAMPGHAHLEWRERRPAEQLHLSNEVRVRMGKATVKYFCAIYEIDL